MTRSPKPTNARPDVVTVTPLVATTLLINGLLDPADADEFRPANLTADSIVTLLHSANESRNRHVSMGHVQKLSRDMSEGHWKWTGDPIQLDDDGFVRNGQHRLLAVIHSGTTQEFSVVRGLDPTAQLVIDVGRPRSVASQLHLIGVSNATMATAIANVLLRWRAGKLMVSTYVPSTMEVHALVDKEDDIPEAIRYITRARKELKRVPLGALGAAFVEGGYIDREKRDEFFNRLVTGADLAAGNPILVLRNTILRTVSHAVRGRRTGQLFQVVHAWNLWRDDKEIAMLRIPSKLSSESFPKMR